MHIPVPNTYTCSTECPVLTQSMKTAELTRFHQSPYWVPHRLDTLKTKLPPSAKRYQCHGKCWRRKTVRSRTWFHTVPQQTNPCRTTTRSIISLTKYPSRIGRILVQPWRLGGSTNKTKTFVQTATNPHAQHKKIYVSQIIAYLINSSQD